MINIKKVRITWDIYECALLHDATLSVFEKGEDKKKIILQLSNLLRRKAVSSGVEIDQFYRNTNGITLQMQKMTFFVTNGKYGLPGGTKLFSDLADIYINDLDLYKKILLEAREMCDIEMTNKERFFEWLSSQISPAQLSELYMVYDDIDEFCRNEKIIRGNLFDVTNLKVLINVRNTVEVNKAFRMKYKKKLSKMSSAIRYYIDYVKDNCSNQIQIKNCDVEIGNRAEIAENQPEIDQINKNVEEINVVTVEGNLIECHRAQSDDNFGHEPNFENEKTYITTNLSESQEHSFTKPVRMEYFGEISVIDNERKVFSNWMSDNQMKPNTISNYISAMNQVQEFVIRHGVTNEILYSISNVDKLEMIFRTLLNNEDFIKWNNDQHNRFRAALAKYIEYRSYVSTNNTVVLVSTSSTPVNAAIPESLVQKYTQLLEEYFPDGFRPMAIHIKKFKLLYENKFSETLELQNEELTNVLEQVGTNIDGRIFAKKSLEETLIIKEINDEIIELFSKGVSCIFLECLMEKYQQELLSELGVYNEDVLAALLLSYGQAFYHRRNGYLQKCIGASNLSEDVLRVLRNNHSPMSYEEIHKELWYLPMDKIKHSLVIEEALVNVDKETYFYAPNLPITQEELLMVENAMHQEIKEKGFMVAKDFPKLLERVVPVVAINISEFKDWGLRNTLGYILRDQFSFGASLVCEKGRTIEMSQAYRDYCKQFIKMKIEDLKEFSCMVNVQIYWNDVLQEMIRISPNELVRKDQIHFDVSAVDNIIDTICQDNYIPIKDVGLFLHFPATEVAWNGFVLESYLLNFSKMFTLYQASISESDFYGVIVHIGSGFDSYADIIVDMLAHSDEWTDKKTALELLVQKGYQARRNLGNIEVLLKEATIKKEQIKRELEAERG